MKRNFNTKDVSQSKIDQNSPGITQKSQLGGEKEASPKPREQEILVFSERVT